MTGSLQNCHIIPAKTAWMTNRYTHPSPGYKLDAVQEALDFAAEALRADVVYPLKEAVG